MPEVGKIEYLDKAKIIAELCRQLKTNTGNAFTLLDEIEDGEYDAVVKP